MSDLIHGQSSWQELQAGSAAGLADFYRELLGWELTDDGVTGVFSLRGVPVAGLRVVEGQTPAAWTVYLATDDLDESLRRVELNGGKVVDPDAPTTAPAPGVRAAVVQDCFGAVFGFTTLSGDAGSPPSSELGRLALADVMTTDIEQGKAFYDAVLQRPRTHQESNLSVYRDEQGHALLGLNQLTPAEQEVLPPHVLPWFVVADDRTAAIAARESGGAVATEGHTFGYGTWGVVNDPAGGAFKALRVTVDRL